MGPPSQFKTQRVAGTVKLPQSSVVDGQDPCFPLGKYSAEHLVISFFFWGVGWGVIFGPDFER